MSKKPELSAGYETYDDRTATLDGAVLQPRDCLPEGYEVGRYRIARRIGMGGMGVVYEALDPQLDRRVALKLVTFAGGSDEERDEARTRMLREAQSLAVLSHPNVVTVYDAGTMDSSVFIAMEFVEGLSLADWIPQEKPTLAEIVRTYCAAGEGLAAAHRAGLVHRDFKPQNVLLGADGRVRVIDFGIARGAQDAFASVTTQNEGDVHSLATTTPNRSGLSSPLTVEGVILGTPRYMSPEQRERKLADTRSDQYCFCCSLYEAIYGKTPVPGADLEKSALGLGRDGKTPPRWLRNVLLRGLALDPADRFESMDALLAELRRDRRAWLTRAMVAVALVVAMAAASATFFREGPEGRCRRGSTQVRNLWTEPSQARLRGVLGGAGVPFADSLFAAVDKGLARFFRAYESSYVQACDATFVRASQSAALLDLRMSCLERRRLQVQRVLQGAGKGATRETLQRIPEAIAHLSNVSHCGDTDSLKQAVPRPDDPKVAAKIEALEKELDAVEALSVAGKHADADALAKATFEKVQHVDYTPLRAQALFRRGVVHQTLARYDDALADYRGAALAAMAGKDSALAARAFINAIHVHANKSELDQGLALSFPTQVLLAAQSDNPVLQADYYATLGSLHNSKSQFKEAEASFRKALSLRSIAKIPDDLDTASLLKDFGPALVALRKVDEAKRVLTRSVELAESILGPDNANMASFLGNLAYVYDEVGDAKKTAELDERVLRMQRATLGEKHPEVGISTVNLGYTMRNLGRWDAADDLMRRGLSILLEAHAPGHVHVAAARVLYASVARERGDDKEALRRYTEAIEKMRVDGHAQTDWMLQALDATAMLSLSEGQLSLAATSVDEALEVAAKIYGESHEKVAYTLTVRARLALTTGRPSDARKDALRALELLEGKDAKLASAAAHFALAQLTRQGDPDAARRHAGEAEQSLHDERSYEGKSLLTEVQRFRRDFP